MIAASAPGRVNLIGEHTDYNGGFVLPAPIPQRTHIGLERRDDDCVIVHSHELDATASYRLGDERHHGNWIDYVQGCTHALRGAGHRVHGVELDVRSDVPLGSGLSSSASLEVAVLRAFRAAFSLHLDDVTLALLGQRAENEIVGAPVGAMDQMAASLGEPGTALFIDMQTLAARRIALPAADLIVIASGIAHDHAAGDYRTRRHECELAARALGVRSLRDLGVRDLGRLAHLPPLLARRARHVITENARVLAAVDAIEQGDLFRLGELFRQSHVSMRDDYAVSLPAIDTLVEIASAQPGVYGARLTGGGFGGSIVAIAERGRGRAAAEATVDAYAARTGHSARILVAGDPTCAPS